jgi:hypothetical protein
MTRHALGPRRSESLESYIRETRTIALVALLAVGAGIVSDAAGSDFWERHALLAGLASSVIVVMLSVAIVNEVVERRRRRRWSVLAQYVMLQLSRNARLIWTGVAELAGVMPSATRTTAALEAGSHLVRDTPRLQKAVEELVADPERRRRLHEGIGRFLAGSDETLGRWAAVMLNADAYAEIIDRHVELASDVSWLDSLLDYSEPASENGARQPRDPCRPAVHIEASNDEARLADRVVTITQLAEDLDRLTLEVARRIVPIEWWEERLGTTPTA